MLLLSLISANSVVSRTDIAHYRKSRVPKPYCLLELTTQHPHAHTIFSWTPLSQGIVVRNLGPHLPRIILTYHYFSFAFFFSLGRSSRLSSSVSAAVLARKAHGRIPPIRYRIRCLRKLPHRARMGPSSSRRQRRHSSRTLKRPRPRPQ